MKFPVLILLSRETEHLSCPRDVPWSLLAPHEVWALRNHGQNLKTLADRGGLAPDEMLAVIEHRRWRPMPMSVAIAQLMKLVSDHVN